MELATTEEFARMGEDLKNELVDRGVRLSEQDWVAVGTAMGKAARRGLHLGATLAAQQITDLLREHQIHIEFPVTHVLSEAEDDAWLDRYGDADGEDAPDAA